MLLSHFKVAFVLFCLSVPLQFSDVDSEDDVTASGAVDGILISRDVAISATAVRSYFFEH